MFTFLNDFTKACSKIREATYGFKAFSLNQNQFRASTGTAFMIAHGVVITAAHALHINNDINQPRHSTYQIIRAPDVGQQMEQCIFIAEDLERDIALLRVEHPHSTRCIQLEQKILAKGTPVGSLGFPLAYIDQQGTFHLVERFQGAHISSYQNQIKPSGRELTFYETDTLMYKGSSGCPGFLVNAKVFGMHNASMIELQTGSNRQERNQETRLAISMWIPATDIIKFVKDNDITI